MWPSISIILPIFSLVSARIFSEVSSPSETNVRGHEASFSSNLDRRENQNLFTDSGWSSKEPDTIPISDLNGANADSLFPGTEFDLLGSDDWAYQMEASTTIGDCNAPTNVKLRLKRYDAQCPNEREEETPICEIALYSVPACCLGPAFAEFVIVNRCAPCRCF